MSATLVFESVKPIKYTCLSDALRYIFTEKYGLINGTYRMNAVSVPYLEGLMDAGSEEVKKDIKLLINAIEKFGEVDIWLQY